MIQSLNNELCIAWPTFIDLNPYEINQELHRHPLMIIFDKCNESCNSVKDSSGKICLPNKTKDGNVNKLNKIRRINESNTLTKHILCD